MPWHITPLTRLFAGSNFWPAVSGDQTMLQSHLRSIAPSDFMIVALRHSRSPAEKHTVSLGTLS